MAPHDTVALVVSNALKWKKIGMYYKLEQNSIINLTLEKPRKLTQRLEFYFIPQPVMFKITAATQIGLRSQKRHESAPKWYKPEK